jgi:ubiquitin conjugation factor E4 B
MCSLHSTSSTKPGLTLYRVNLEFFVRFVNLLLNDVTFVLDESFTSFKEIHEVSKLLEDAANMDQNVRQENEEKLSAAQGKAKSYMQLTNETVAMLKLFTEALADSFTKKEVVVRLAHMLDFNLEALVGPKRANLRIKNPEEYGWNPTQMLAEVTDVYLNLQGKQSFIDAVATDGRAYRPEYWTEAHKILTKWKLKKPQRQRNRRIWWRRILEKFPTTTWTLLWLPSWKTRLLYLLANRLSIEALSRVTCSATRRIPSTVRRSRSRMSFRTTL